MRPGAPLAPPTIYHWLFATRHLDLEHLSLLASDSLGLLQPVNHRSALFDLLAKEAPPFLTEHLVAQLAAGGVFDVRSGTSSSVEALAKVLGRVSRLFTSPLPLPLSVALNQQQQILRPLVASEFHSFMIQFSAEHKLPRFLVSYLASHKLGLGDPTALDPTTLVPGNTAPWVSMLLHFRVPAGLPREELALALTKASVAGSCEAA